MVTPFGAACLPVVHARKVRSCSPHRQGMAFLWGFFRSLGGGDAAIDAGRLLSAQRFFPTVGITVSPAPAHLLTVHAHWEECGPSLFVRQVFRALTALQPCVVPPSSARPLSVTAPHDSKICPHPAVLRAWLSRLPPPRLRLSPRSAVLLWLSDRSLLHAWGLPSWEWCAALSWLSPAQGPSYTPPRAQWQWQVQHRCSVAAMALLAASAGRSPCALLRRWPGLLSCSSRTEKTKRPWSRCRTGILSISVSLRGQHRQTQPLSG